MSRKVKLQDLRPGMVVLNMRPPLDFQAQFPFKLSSLKRCPGDSVPNFCSVHQYAYINWFIGLSKAFEKAIQRQVEVEIEG